MGPWSLVFVNTGPTMLVECLPKGLFFPHILVESFDVEGGAAQSEAHHVHQNREDLAVCLARNHRRLNVSQVVPSGIKMLPLTSLESRWANTSSTSA